jgi:hypothetical protein
VKLSKSESASALDGLGHCLEHEPAPVEQIATRVDQQGSRRDLSRRAGNRVTVEPIEARVAQHQAWWSQLRRQEFLESKTRRVATTGELRHEDDPARFHQRDQPFQLGQVVGHRQGAIDRLARGAGQRDRMETEPLARQQVDHVDIRPLDQSREPLAGRTADLCRLELGASEYVVVDRRDPEPIREAC